VKLAIAATAPGILTIDNSHALAVNHPGAVLNSAAAPAPPGDYVVLYATGQGLLDRPVTSGAEPPEGAPSVPLAAVEVKVGGIPAHVAFAGLAPGFVGLLQVNIVVPKSAPGDQPVELTVGKVTAPAARLWVGADP
jgi:adhesin/invasin